MAFHRNLTFEEILEKDENGNIVLEQHADGFREESVYINNNLVRRRTRYSNGIVETESWAVPKN